MYNFFLKFAATLKSLAVLFYVKPGLKSQQNRVSFPSSIIDMGFLSLYTLAVLPISRYMHLTKSLAA